MLTIRPEQFAALAEPALADAVARIGDHLRVFFPERLEHWSDNDTRTFVQRVVRRAHGMGIRSVAALCKFTILALLLGEHFDTDATHPWAARTWSDMSEFSPDQRVHRLAVIAEPYLEAASS